MGHELRGQERPRFCASCGGALAEDRDATTHGWPCAGCGTHAWLDPKVVACAVPFVEGRVLLARRGLEPRYGFWVTPGGYCERGERPSAAAERETLEEVGLVVRATDLLGVYAYDGSPVVVIVYDCEVLEGSPRALDEVLEVKLVRPGDIPWDELAFPSNRDSLSDALRRRGFAVPGPGGGA